MDPGSIKWACYDRPTISRLAALTGQRAVGQIETSGYKRMGFWRSEK